MKYGINVVNKIVLASVSLAFLYVLMAVFLEINKTAPAPYIDEIFHIPQAKHYCKLQFFKWDPKITTLPGLYLVSLAWIKPLEWLYGFSLCTVYGLRFVNIVGTFINFVVCYVHFNNKYPKGKCSLFLNILSALNIATFPPVFFFSFLYYTDVWSTTFILFMYFLHSTKSYFSASIMGACAIFMRQTNVVWIGLLFLDAGWREFSKGVKVATLTDVLLTIPKCLCINSIRRVLLITWPYIIICLGFVLFVIVNRGIVVGDKTAHLAVFHPMQFLYFLDVAAFFAIPFIVFEIPGLFKTKPNIPVMCTLWMICAILSEYNLLQHPYLLADNRHINFYLWRRLFGNIRYRRLLTPTYVVSGLLLYRIIKKCHVIFIVGLVICTACCLVPQHLFEIRYFIIPYLIMRMNFPNTRQRTAAICMETIFYSFINYLIIRLFLTRSFRWESEPEQLQRIIW